jgi:hypothetical protein
LVKKITYLFLVMVLVSLTTCKRKTTITLRVFNPALDEYVANAKVVLIERKVEGSGGSGILRQFCG